MQRLVRRSRQRDERGMTLIEVTVTVALTGIVMAMVTVIIVNVLNETRGEAAGLVGVQQAQVAERTFTQYLRSAVSLLAIQSNDITFTTYTGTVSGVPQLETMEAQLCPTKSAFVDSLEIIQDLPQSPTPGWNGLHECISPNSPGTTTLAVPANVRLVEAFDVQPPKSTDIFTYYKFSGSSFTAMSSTATASSLATEIAAIRINVTFLPPPGAVSKGYHAEFGTSLSTEIFLKNETASAS